MTISTIDESQRTAAKIAGLAFPISFAIVVAVNCRPWRGCISAVTTRTTSACCIGDWEPRLPATCGSSRTTSPERWLPLV